jgi:hypothetical protein
VSGSAGATTLTTPQIPSHQHSVTEAVNFPGVPSTGFTLRSPNTSGAPFITATIGATGGGGSHTHPFSFSSGSGTFSGSAINLAVKYYDFIIATID